jgi:hypothetical protein
VALVTYYIKRCIYIVCFGVVLFLIPSYHLFTLFNSLLIYLLSPFRFSHSTSYILFTFLVINDRGFINSLNRRIARLAAHEKCLQFLTHYYPIVEAAKDTKSHRQYRTVSGRITCLQRQDTKLLGEHFYLPSGKSNIIIIILLSIHIELPTIKCLLYD